MHARAWPPYSSLSWICPLLLGLLLATAGCGSTLYVNQVTRKASASVAAAEAVNAAEYAPYWYTLAVEYLHKAREEAAHADFEAANRFGRKSEAAAERARMLAVQRAANPKDKSWRPPPGVPGSADAAGTPGGEADDGAGDEATGEAGDQAPDQAGDQASDQASDQAGDQASDQAGDQAGDADSAAAAAGEGPSEDQTDGTAEDKQ